ncbi:MAG: hypothetical protein ABI662_03370 [Dermatophilaceae bacterium]
MLGAMAMNFLLTGIDVLMAHSQNNVFRWEVIPLVYVPFAVLAILAHIVVRPNVLERRTFQSVMWLGVVVGAVGTLLHLTGNAISSPMSVHQLLVAGSPIAAPVAFAGIASFALASDRHRGSVRSSKLCVLVGLGFFGAVLAAFLDHARIGYVPGYTLIPIASGTLGTIACLYMARVRASRRETYIFLSVLGLNVLVGLLGFWFHLMGDLAGTQSVVWARILYRAPLFGPLLFCNLAMLGALSMLPEPDEAMEGRAGDVSSLGIPSGSSQLARR